ncbi:MAG: hypothetical protein ACI9WO_001014 [Sphingobacteriales bacterium]|jgi:hypothetical protein
MKRFALAVLSFLVLACSINVKAAEAYYTTSDSQKTLESLSLYRTYLKQNNVVDAIGPWRWLFLNAPEAREFVYIDGASKILPYLITNATTDELKESRIDTLMMVFDQRIQYFGKEGSVLGRKGYAMLQYRPRASDDIRSTLGKSIELEGNKSSYFILFPYFQLFVNAQQDGKLTKQEVMDVYNNLSGVIEANVSGGSKYANNYATAGDNIDIKLAEVIESCQEIQDLYSAKYKANPNDEKLIDAVYNLMAGKACYDLPMFSEVATKKFKKDQDAGLAYNIAKALMKKNDYSTAKSFLEKAVEIEADPEKKAAYYIEMAIVTYSKLGQYTQARGYAREAAALRPNWGVPALTIGDIYFNGAKTISEETEKWGAYWAAIDKYQTAKNMDGSIASDAQARINSVSPYLPDQETAFFNSLNSGASFSCSSWIGESTSVKIRK